MMTIAFPLWGGFDPTFELGEDAHHRRIIAMALQQRLQLAVGAGAQGAYLLDEELSPLAASRVVTLRPWFPAEMVAAVAIDDEGAHVGRQAAEIGVRDGQFRRCAGCGHRCPGGDGCSPRRNVANRRCASRKQHARAQRNTPGAGQGDPVR